MMQGASAARIDPAAMQMRLDHMQARMREMTQIMDQMLQQQQMMLDTQPAKPGGGH